MTLQIPSAQPPPPRWWINVSGETEGPHSYAFILARLKGGKLASNTLACPEGNQDWKPLDAWPQFAAVLDRGRWWLHRSGNPDGPHTEQQVLALLTSGQLEVTTLACPEGGEQWKPIMDWPMFAHAVPHQPTLSKPSASPSVTGKVASPARSQMPAMVNWICVYSIAIRPTLWFIGNASSLVLGFDDDYELLAFLIGAAMDTVLTIFLLIGGLQLRELRRSGIKTLKLTMATWLVVFGLMLLVGLPLMALGTTSEYVEPMSAGDYFACFLIPFYLAEIVFQVTALVWLVQNGRRLKLAS